jgi:hypothetical protein
MKLKSIDKPFIKARPFKPKSHRRGIVDRLTATGIMLKRSIVTVFPYMRRRLLNAGEILYTSANMESIERTVYPPSYSIL